MCSSEHPLRVYQRSTAQVLECRSVLGQLQGDEPRPLAGPRRLTAHDAFDGCRQLLLRLRLISVQRPMMLVIAATTAMNRHRIICRTICISSQSKPVHSCSYSSTKWSKSRPMRRLSSVG